MDILTTLEEARRATNVLEHPFYRRWSAGEMSSGELFERLNEISAGEHGYWCYRITLIEGRLNLMYWRVSRPFQRKLAAPSERFRRLITFASPILCRM